MSTGAKCLRIARACNQSFFLNSVYPLVMHMISQGAKKYRIANALLKYFNKHQGDFSYVTKTRIELLTIIWF